jgi:tRNA modification GTPase
MHGKLTGWEDTIIALATPQGVGAIGVIRLSGQNAFAIVNQLFPSKDLQTQTSHTMHVGFLHYNDELLDEVVVSLFKNPKSFTGEDVVEISCHGSSFIQSKVMDACAALGARLAKPGEFTQRAYLNGKMDLTQAEAVADIIASNTEASRNTALKNMRGGFSHDLQILRDQLITFSSLIELELDFSTEDVEFADRKQFFDLIDAAEQKTKALLQSFQLGNVIKNGVQVAIIGKPNAGKSTLLNTLLNEDRAIVSEIAGTTRDTIEETLQIDGILFRLVDTAGIREHSVDVIENLGIEKSLAKMQEADVVVYLFDVQQISVAELQTVITKLQAEQINFILVGNKAEADVATKFASIAQSIIYISAKQKQNIQELKTALFHSVVGGKVNTESTIVTNARHYASLQNVDTCLTEIKAGLQNKLPGDLLSLDIRRCLHFLGEITGEITNEDQLDYIFSKFCIGK